MNNENINKIHDIYVDTLTHGRDIYDNKDMDMSDLNIFKLNSTATYLTQMNKKLMKIINISEKFITGCNIKVEKIKEENILEKKYAGNPDKIMLIFKEINMGLKWGDISDIADEKENLLDTVDKFIKTERNPDEYKNNKISYKTLNKIYGVRLDFDFKLPIINEINDIPPSLYWYKGDKKYDEGIYMTLNDGVFVKVPFPDTIDYMDTYHKKNTIKCKNKTIEECNKFRNSINKYNENYVHNCNYLHTGDKILKINNIVRCSTNSKFGKHSCLNKDLENTTYSDIQSLMVYSISDILLNSLWIQKQNNIGNNQQKIIDNIEIST
jgi:hypothetical protein